MISCVLWTVAESLGVKLNVPDGVVSKAGSLSNCLLYSSSPNYYKYRNREKNENIYDEVMYFIGSYYPTERNRSGAYKDLHVLQEIYYNTGEGDKFGLNAWYINSNRELAMLSTDYGNDMDFENR